MIMKHGSLVAFLSGDLSSEKFMEEIADEITAFYADLRNTNQGVVKISSGLPFVVTRSAARHLLAAISTQALSPDAAVYVADCIVASDDISFADEAARDAVFFVEDDSGRFAHGRDDVWTSEEILQALASLDQE